MAQAFRLRVKLRRTAVALAEAVRPASAALKRCALTVAIVTCTVVLSAQPQHGSRATGSEAATARRFAAIRNQPLQLLAFLRQMPKGGDLHNHLSGAIYAESYLRWAADDKSCLVTATMVIVMGPCDAGAGRPPVVDVLQNATLFNQAVDAMSMRNWDRSLNGHDHFFAAFGKLGPTSTRTGDMLAEVMARAAGEHVSYLELMLTPAAAATARLAREVGWNPDLPALRNRLLAAGLRDAVIAEGTQRLDAAETRQRELLHCVRLRSPESSRAAAGQVRLRSPESSRAAAGQVRFRSPESSRATAGQVRLRSPESSRAAPGRAAERPDPGCAVTVRYVAQVARSAAPEQVFAQMLAGFELTGADPRVVSLNLVQPEDDPNAIGNFMLEMEMLDFLHGLYPRTPITLHAGELAEGMVPPDALRFHIRQSVEKGHARRIGHGVSLINEDDPFGLLREMAARKVLVEIALTSNDLILGIKGKRHPLKLYLQHGVPVAIVTDDYGVSRSTHTEEFLKAVQEHDLDYLTLKRLARNSLEFSFADVATKMRLTAALESAFTAFERR